MDELAKQLTELGYAVDAQAYRSQNVVLIRNYEVMAGPHAGSYVDIGIPAPDFPVSGPAGLHFRAPLGRMGCNGVNQSPLGGEWQYWSRRLDGWGANRNAHRIIAYINKILLEDVR